MSPQRSSSSFPLSSACIKGNVKREGKMLYAKPRAWQQSSSSSSSSASSFGIIQEIESSKLDLSRKGLGRYARIFASSLSSTAPISRQTKVPSSAKQTTVVAVDLCNESDSEKSVVDLQNDTDSEKSLVDLQNDSVLEQSEILTPIFSPSTNTDGVGIPSLRNIIVEDVDTELLLSFLRGDYSDRILVEKFSQDMTINKFKSLAPEKWLNDEVINFYFNMLTEACNHHKLGIHCFSSFFFIKLLVEKNGYHFNKVKRWTKKIDIFALNKIFIPVNITNTHWGLVLIDIVLKTIIYFDSFRHSGPYASAALQVSTLTILVVLF